MDQDINTSFHEVLKEITIVVIVLAIYEIVKYKYLDNRRKYGKRKVYKSNLELNKVNSERS